MSLKTNLQGRLRNTTLPKSHALLPLFEAVINAIHAIEDKGNILDGGKIEIKVNRVPQKSLDFASKSLAQIVEFEISDNGCGFDELNFISFETLDSPHKIDRGGRGIGRLMWLKAFDYATIDSIYLTADEKINKRSFTFNEKQDVHNTENMEILDLSTPTGSIVKLINFKESYRKHAPARIDSLANQLLEHCLWYFVRAEGVPLIVVKDETNEVSLNDLYDKTIHAQVYPEKLNIKNSSFELTHVKFRNSINKTHHLSLCANGRLVQEDNISSKIPGLYSVISDEFGEFIYTCYVSSSYLDEAVVGERTHFTIPEKNEGIFDETEISLDQIRKEVLNRIKLYLEKDLEKNVVAGKKRVQDFIDNVAPRYRPITSYVPEENLIVNPDISDKDLELHLHKYWFDVERQVLLDGHNIMEPSNEEQVEDYRKRLSEYLKKTEDLKKSDLANYVSHRKVIIDLLQKNISKIGEEKYAKEEVIHELIMPMQRESKDVFAESCNLWLIDERLAFHNYLASDKTIKSMPITDSQSTKEPDLLNLKVFDNPLLVNDSSNLPLASITVIEIKRPMRNNFNEGEDKDPIAQALGYVERIREGNVQTKGGLLIPRSEDIPAYCYVICDLTSSMVTRCKNFGLTPTADRMGYFGYNHNYKSYIEVISFNQLVKSAKERNKAFFDKLGLPSN